MDESEVLNLIESEAARLVRDNADLWNGRAEQMAASKSSSPDTVTDAFIAESCFQPYGECAGQVWQRMRSILDSTGVIYTLKLRDDLLARFSRIISEPERKSRDAVQSIITDAQVLLGFQDRIERLRESYNNGINSHVLQRMADQEKEDRMSGNRNQHNSSLNDPDVLTSIIKIITHFHAAAVCLRNRRVGRPALEVKDEYDVQYLLHALLRVFFDDVRAEEPTPSYACGSRRMDFLLKAQETVVEVKMMRDTMTLKEVGEQLVIDIHTYTAHPACKRLVCFVYDPEHRIANPVGLEEDLTKPTDGLDVHVFIFPK